MAVVWLHLTLPFEFEIQPDPENSQPKALDLDSYGLSAL